ncbi:MAG TPA: hypothetical protein VFJ58_28210 [Armatimonadota bacterium]|nr:hypothetical protein [Armatimonadota bacterium]
MTNERERIMDVRREHWTNGLCNRIFAIRGCLFALTLILPSSGSAHTRTVVRHPLFAYVANQGDNTISQYRVLRSGKLTPLSPAAITAPEAALSLTAGPGGCYLYAILGKWTVIAAYRRHLTPVARPLYASPDKIMKYLVLPNGSLRSAGLVRTTVPHLQALAFDPGHGTAYVLNNDSRVFQFHVRADGSFAPLNPAYAGVSLHHGAISGRWSLEYRFLAIDPQHHALFTGAIGHQMEEEIGYAQVFHLGADGAASARQIYDAPPGGGVAEILIDPRGRFVYVSPASIFDRPVRGGPGIMQYRIGPRDRLLPIDGAAQSAAGPGVIDPRGRFLYILYDEWNRTHIQPYLIQKNGALKMLPSTKLDASASSAAIDPSGRWLYATDVGGVSLFRILSTGALRMSSGTETPAGADPVSIIFMKRS